MASRKEAGTDRQAVEYGDQRVERGQGGETHQVASGDAPRLTTQQGIVLSDDQNTLRAGERGPDVLEDFHFREKIFTSTMSGFPSGWCTPAATGRTGSSRTTSR